MGNARGVTAGERCDSVDTLDRPSLAAVWELSRGNSGNRETG